MTLEYVPGDFAKNEADVTNILDDFEDKQTHTHAEPHAINDTDAWNRNNNDRFV